MQNVQLWGLARYVLRYRQNNVIRYKEKNKKIYIKVSYRHLNRIIAQVIFYYQIEIFCQNQVFTIGSTYGWTAHVNIQLESVLHRSKG